VLAAGARLTGEQIAERLVLSPETHPHTHRNAARSWGDTRSSRHMA